MMWIWSRCGSSRGRGSSVLRQLLECQVVLAIILIALAQETSSSPLLLQVPLSKMLGPVSIHKELAIGGLHSTEVAQLPLTQQPRVRFLVFPITFLLMLLSFIEGSTSNSGQRLENVNGTHLVLASGKLVLQKPQILGAACLIVNELCPVLQL